MICFLLINEIKINYLCYVCKLSYHASPTFNIHFLQPQCASSFTRSLGPIEHLLVLFLLHIFDPFSIFKFCVIDWCMKQFAQVPWLFLFLYFLNSPKSIFYQLWYKCKANYKIKWILLFKNSMWNITLQGKMVMVKKKIDTQICQTVWSMYNPKLVIHSLLVGNVLCPDISNIQDNRH